MAIIEVYSKVLLIRILVSYYFVQVNKQLFKYVIQKSHMLCANTGNPWKQSLENILQNENHVQKTSVHILLQGTLISFA